MCFADTTHKFLIAAGLAALVLSIVFDPNFATDGAPPSSVPEPTTTALLAIGGVAALTAGLMRRKK